MGLENDHGRPATVKMFNSIPDTVWIPNRLVEFAPSAKTSGTYTSGTPDAFVCMNGRFVAIECKAFSMLVDLSKWSESQERWYSMVALKSNMKYYISLWVLHTTGSSRIYNKNAHLFLVPPVEWIALRELAAAKNRITVGIYPNAVKEKYADLCILPRWEQYRCSLNGSLWRIPDSHPIWTA